MRWGRERSAGRRGLAASAAVVFAVAAWGPVAQASTLDASGHLAFDGDALWTQGFESLSDAQTHGASWLAWADDVLAATLVAESDWVSSAGAGTVSLPNAMEGSHALKLTSGGTVGLAFVDPSFPGMLSSRRVQVSFWGLSVGAEPELDVVYPRGSEPLGPGVFGRVVAVRTGRETSDGWAEYSTGPVDGQIFGDNPLGSIILTARFATNDGTFGLDDIDLDPSLSLDAIQDPTAYALADAIEIEPVAGSPMPVTRCTQATVSTACGPLGEHPGSRHALWFLLRDGGGRPLGERHGRSAGSGRRTEGVGHPRGHRYGPGGGADMVGPVTIRLARALAASGLLLTAGCESSGDGRPPFLQEKAPDGPDASMDRAADTRAGDAATDVAVAPVDRSLTTRGLLATPVNNLLLDPFITSDVFWGHFRAVVPAVDPAQTGSLCPNLTREVLSASPIGVSAPVVLVNERVLPAAAGCTAIIAPFVGSTEAVSAQIWVASTDAGTADIDSIVTVAILPNALPSSPSPPASYPLTLATTPPTVLSGREWRLLELAAPVSLPEGGWFAITLSDPAAGLYLAAPQIVPATTTTLSLVIPLAVVRSRPMTDLEHGAILQYGRLLRTHTPLRRRSTPKRRNGSRP